MTALLALPAARHVASELDDIEDELGALTAAMVPPTRLQAGSRDYSTRS
jgi:uncharacterized membrane-anchored protein